MELIIKISDKMFDTFKKHGIMTFDNLNEYDRDMIADAIANGTPYNSSGDLIGREALKKDIEKRCGEPFDYIKTIVPVLNAVDNTQTVEISGLPKIHYDRGFIAGYEKGKAERPQGEWIIVKDEKYGDNVKCPFCGKELAGTDLNFCCKCGAEMKGGAE